MMLMVTTVHNVGMVMQSIADIWVYRGPTVQQLDMYVICGNKGTQMEF